MDCKFEGRATFAEILTTVDHCSVGVREVARYGFRERRF